MKPASFDRSAARRIALFAIALLTLAGLAACGDDEDTGADAAPGTEAETDAEAEAETGVDEDAAVDDGGTEADEETAAAPEPPAAEEPTAEPSPEPTAEPEPVEPFRILVTNDDGIASGGIDALVNALSELPDVEITVVAPAENQSGSSDTRSEGEVTAAEAATLSGFPAIAVTGTPADSVVYALANVVTEPPHLIVSGSNDGENIGPFAQISGTVGAARTGAREGIPGLAVSQGGVSVEPEFDVGVPIAIDWIVANRDELQARETGGLAPVVSINTPSCGDTGELEGVVETTLGADFGDFAAFTVDCSVEVDPIVTDVDAFFSGYAAITLLPEDLVAGTTGG
jgi:5'-nucleotidase